ncbi:MAG: hypothetical protein HYV16_14050 [Gammaproteobacteria bacterium]|nr:hypothetical protein [Gammaproteobacteria bacterium]
MAGIHSGEHGQPCAVIIPFPFPAKLTPPSSGRHVADITNLLSDIIRKERRNQAANPLLDTLQRIETKLDQLLAH